MPRSPLAQKIARWGELHAEIDALEAEIKPQLLELGSNQRVGNVKVTYFAGRKNYDYEDVGQDAKQEMVDKYTTIFTKTDWRKLVLEGMQIGQEIIPFTQSAPSIKLKVVKE